MLPRPEVIRLLCNTALEAMNAVAAEATQDEVYIACLCVAKQTVLTAVRSGANLEPLRAIVAKIYEDFPAEKVN